jgi:hypothetical protein
MACKDCATTNRVGQNGNTSAGRRAIVLPPSAGRMDATLSTVSRNNPRANGRPSMGPTTRNGSVPEYRHIGATDGLRYKNGVLSPLRAERSKEDPARLLSLRSVPLYPIANAGTSAIDSGDTKYGGSGGMGGAGTGCPLGWCFFLGTAYARYHQSQIPEYREIDERMRAIRGRPAPAGPGAESRLRERLQDVQELVDELQSATSDYVAGFEAQLSANAVANMRVVGMCGGECACIKGEEPPFLYGPLLQAGDPAGWYVVIMIAVQGGICIKPV